MASPNRSTASCTSPQRPQSVSSCGAATARRRARAWSKTSTPGPDGSYPVGFTQLPGRGRFVFNARHPRLGFELWISDGTASGTRVLTDIASGQEDSGPTWLTAFKDGVAFRLSAGSLSNELWWTDGTAANTRRIFSSRAGFVPLSLTAFRGALYFSAKTTKSGRELWRSDGTAQGTQLFVDLNPGVSSSNPAYLVPVGERMYFAATTPAAGRELFVTDGSVAGTRLRADIWPGQRSSRPILNRGGFHDGPPKLRFAAADPQRGFEPFELWLPFAQSNKRGEGCGTLDHVPTLDANTPRLGSTLELRSAWLEPATLGTLVLGAPLTQRIPWGPCSIPVWPPLVVLDAWRVPNHGRRHTRVRIANLAALDGLQVAFQTWNLTTKTASGLSSSNGLYARIGK